MSPGMLSLEEFRRDAEEFLAARYERRLEQRVVFRWGEGSDRVGTFEESDPGREAERVVAVRAWRRDLFDNGYGWIAGPSELGGRGLPSAYNRAFEALVRGFDVVGNAMLTVSLGMIAPTILVHGSATAKQKYLGALYRGDLIGCQLFSEPGAGSDLASVSMKAERDGDGWRLTGQKVWTSGAQFSDVGEAICRTSAGPRHRNLTAFVVDMHAPGVTVRPLRQMTGGAAFNEVFLDDVWVHDDDRLGEVGEGWRVALTTLSNERSAIGGEGFGGAGVLDMDRYRQMLVHFGRQDDPVLRNLLADLYIQTRTAKYLRQRQAAGARGGQGPGPEATLGKLSLSANMARVMKFVSAALGPTLIADSGEWGTFAWSEFVCGMPGFRLGGGTDEVLKTLIAERVLGLPKEPS